MGISKKIEDQVEAFNSYENTEAIYYKDKVKGVREKIIQRIPIFSKQHFRLKEIDLKRHNAVYIRRLATIDLNLLLFLRKCKNNNLTVVFEIPTYPYKNESKLSLSTATLLLKEKVWGNFLKRYVDRIATFSNDEEIFGIETINIYNGANFKKITKKSKPFSKDNITLACVASHEYWHGYDRLIKGVGNYLLENKSKKIKILIIGNGPEKIFEEYKEIAMKYGIEKNIEFIGEVNKEQLNIILNDVDIAVDSLGRHRSGVYYNSSLKGKEYLAKGLPIISGVKTELDNYPMFEYYYRVPADDSSIDMSVILEKYNGTICNENEQDTAKVIRDFGYENFDVMKVLIPVWAYFSQKIR